MRTSVDQIRDLTVDALDAAREQASGLIEAQAGRLASGVDLLVERAPIPVDLRPPRPGRRWILVVVLVVVGGVAFAALRRRGRATPPAEPPAPVREPVPVPA